MVRQILIANFMLQYYYLELFNKQYLKWSFSERTIMKIRISLYHSMKIREMGYSTKNSAQLSEQNMSVGFGGRVTVF